MYSSSALVEIINLLHGRDGKRSSVYTDWGSLTFIVVKSRSNIPGLSRWNWQRLRFVTSLPTTTWWERNHRRSPQTWWYTSEWVPKQFSPHCWEGSRDCGKLKTINRCTPMNWLSQNNTYYKGVEKVNQYTAERVMALYYRVSSIFHSGCFERVTCTGQNINLHVLERSVSVACSNCRYRPQ
jgi:hypothetical protein